jgi:hypothetical protein
VREPCHVTGEQVRRMQVRTQGARRVSFHQYHKHTNRSRPISGEVFLSPLLVTSRIGSMPQTSRLKASRSQIPQGAGARHACHVPPLPPVGGDISTRRHHLLPTDLILCSLIRCDGAIPSHLPVSPFISCSSDYSSASPRRCLGLQ